MNPNFIFDIEQVIDMARKYGELETRFMWTQGELRKMQRSETPPEPAEVAHLKETINVLEGMLAGNREVDGRIAARAREALRSRGWKNSGNVAGLGSAVNEMIAFLDYSLPVPAEPAE